MIGKPRLRRSEERLPGNFHVSTSTTSPRTTILRARTDRTLRTHSGARVTMRMIDAAKRQAAQNAEGPQKIAYRASRLG
jgi:hypothetical protein